MRPQWVKMWKNRIFLEFRGFKVSVQTHSMDVKLLIVIVLDSNGRGRCTDVFMLAAACDACVYRSMCCLHDGSAHRFSFLEVAEIDAVEPKASGFRIICSLNCVVNSLLLFLTDVWRHLRRLLLNLGSYETIFPFLCLFSPGNLLVVFMFLKATDSLFCLAATKYYFHFIVFFFRNNLI